MSQEELANLVHVSRQTISNWENNKSYPDIQSLVLIAECFKISLDELVKGDIVNMKSQLERNEMNKYANGMLIGFILMIISIPFVKIISPYCFIFTIISGGGMMWSAFEAEKIKKDKNIQTYKQILDYMENGRIPNEVNNTKGSIFIKFIYGIVSGVIVGLLVLLILKLF